MHCNSQTSIGIFTLLFLFSMPLFAQGTWDIAYAPITDVDFSWIGREVRIDIKPRKGEVDTSNIQALLSAKDVTRIIVGGETITFTEDWRIEADQGLLKDQLLLANEDWVVKEQFIVMADDEHIIIKVYAYKLEEGVLVKHSEELFDIPKTKLSGVFYSTD